MIFEFKAKDVYNGKWIYGDLTRTTNNPETISSYKINNKLVNLNTISMYLNHNDKFNRKIFNYDIINVNNKTNYLIFYNNEQCAFSLLILDKISINEYKNKLNCLTILPGKNWWNENKYNIEIIGNLFDNINLLNGLTYDDVIKLNYS